MPTLQLSSVSLPWETALVSNVTVMAYAIGQLPMGWLCQRFPIAKVIATCVILWGITVMCMGAAHNYAQLAALRVLLGLFESVLTPGFALLTASWYLRSEQTIRQVCYYTMSTFITVISNVIIYYLALHVQTHGGIAAWRVINLFLGGLTVFIGILNLLVWGTPENAWWLTKEEKNIARSRIVSNASECHMFTRSDAFQPVVVRVTLGSGTRSVDASRTPNTTFSCSSTSSLLSPTAVSPLLRHWSSCRLGFRL